MLPIDLTVPANVPKSFHTIVYMRVCTCAHKCVHAYVHVCACCVDTFSQPSHPNFCFTGEARPQKNSKEAAAPFARSPVAASMLCAVSCIPDRSVTSPRLRHYSPGPEPNACNKEVMLTLPILGAHLVFYWYDFKIKSPVGGAARQYVHTGEFRGF